MKRADNYFTYLGNEPMRLDRFLKQSLSMLSLRDIQQLIAQGVFTQNLAGLATPLRKGDRLEKGATIVWVNMPNLRQIPLANPKLTIKVHYEDEHLLVVEKPAGIATHPLSVLETDTLANALVAMHPQLYGVGKKPLEPGLVHRLDQGTSGLLLVAKDDDAFKRLQKLWRRQSLQKGYLALVHGNVPKPLKLELPLQHDPQDKRRMRVVLRRPARSGGKVWPAQTRIQPQQHYKAHTLLEVSIQTGVTHQIRVHLSHQKHPIVGDQLYGSPLATSSLPHRHFLHAHRLVFEHPYTQTTISLQSDLPDDLKAFLQQHTKGVGA